MQRRSKFDFTKENEFWIIKVKLQVRNLWIEIYLA